MPRLIRYSRLAAPLLLAGLAAFAATGCTKAARLKRREQKADRAFAEGKFDEAEIAYLNVLHSNGTDGDAVAHLGVIYYEEGRFKRGFSYLLGAQTLAPEFLDARLRLGLSYLALGKLKEASDEGTYVLERDPGNAQAPVLLAEAQSDPAARVAARARLAQLPAADQARAPVQTALAVLALHDRKVVEAEAALNAALAADPHFSMAHSVRASIGLARKDFAVAEQEFKAASDEAPARSPWRLQYARFRLQQGDVPGAAAFLESLVAETPDFLPAVLLLAEIQDQQKHLDESLSTVEKVLGREPALREAVLLKAMILLEKGEAAKAVTYLEGSAGQFPHDGLYQFDLAKAYLAAGDGTKGKAALVAALNRQPDLPVAAEMLARRDLQDSDPAGAVAVLLPIVKAHPEMVDARYQLADAYLAEKDYDEATAIYAGLSGTTPRDPRPHQLAGMAQVRLGRLAAARREFEAALAIDPDYFPALERLVYLDMDDRKMAEAERKVRARLDASPKEAESYALLAQVLFTRKSNAEAEQAAKAAIELKPALPLPYLLLAKLYATENHLELAAKYAADAVQREPADVEALLLLGTIDEQANDFKGAQGAYEQILAHYPGSGPALNNLAYIYAEKLSNLPKGLELAQLARKSLPNDPNVADTLGWIGFLSGQYSWARSLLREATANLPADPTVHYHLAKADYMLGDEAAAKQEFQQSLSLAGAFPDRNDAERLVAILSIDPAAPRPGDAALLEKQLSSAPNDAAILSRLAAIYRSDGQLDKAIDAGERAVRANPNDANAAIVLAQLYLAKGSPARAYEVANEAHKRSPQDARVAGVLGQLAFQKGDFPWSLSLLRTAHEGSTDDPEVFLALARAEYSEGLASQAAGDARAAGALPGNPAVSKQAQEFGRMVALADDPAAATAEVPRLEKMVADDPNDVPALMALAVSDLSKGNDDGARSQLETVLRVYPDFVPAERQLLILYASKGDAAKGALLVSKVREALPDDPQVAKAGGIIFYRNGDFSKAADLLANASLQLPNDPELEFFLGMTLHGMKDPKDNSHLKRALDLHLSGDMERQARSALKP